MDNIDFLMLGFTLGVVFASYVFLFITMFLGKSKNKYPPLKKRD